MSDFLRLADVHESSYDDGLHENHPPFEDPIAICAIDELGRYHFLEYVNGDKICTELWDNEAEYISEFEHDTLASCVVQCKFIYDSYQSYEGEWDGNMEIIEDKVLW
jgi:hypothetical protein